MDRTTGADHIDLGAGRRGFRDENVLAGVAGTELLALWLNGVQEELLAVIEAAGIEPDPQDWTQLLQALQMLFAPDAGNDVTQPMARTYMPIHPEALTADGKLSVTAGAGSVTVADGQGFVHRGVFGVLTTDWDAAARTFVTAASKTYHLRWTWDVGGGTGAFALRDLADAGYNPGALGEGHPSFDSAYDDMLIARVVTDGANAVTVTPLVNKGRLSYSALQSFGSPPFNTVNAWRGDWSFPLDWSRSPKYALAPHSKTTDAGQATDYDQVVHVTAADRYEVTGFIISDFPEFQPTVNLLATA